MSKNTEFKMEAVMQLKLVSSQKDEPEEETALTGLAGGCCIDFNKVSEHLFIVGTEEGKIHKCSKAYSGQYLETYEGSHGCVRSSGIIFTHGFSYLAVPIGPSSCGTIICRTQ